MERKLERKIESKLIKWKDDLNRLPLVLYGARQVGKTYSLLRFGEKYYQNVAYFNMEDSRDIPLIFERDFNPERIVKELSAKSGEKITRDKTLIIFDEIQASERALTSLKYFAENAPGYHIATAGSLLGVAINREGASFPVGKVDMLNMYPLDFEEFLWASGQKGFANLIRDSYLEFAPFSLHEDAMDMYKKYLQVGGMPSAVNAYIEEKSVTEIQIIQSNLNNAYIADMAKYTTASENVRIAAAWSSIPAQLAKENHKFQYRVIKSGARAKEYEVALQWLENAGLINKCIRVAEGKDPLIAYAENSAFKAYMCDTGLLFSKFGVSLDLIQAEYRGAVAENYVMQALTANGHSSYYWESDGKAELDFVIQDRNKGAIPIEVKSGENVRSKSLNRFIELYSPEYGIRVSSKNFGFENGIKAVPLYAVFCL